MIHQSQLNDPDTRQSLHYIAQAYDFGLKVLERMENEYQQAVEAGEKYKAGRIKKKIYNQKYWLRELDSRRVIKLK